MTSTGVLCATEAPKAGLLCASVLQRDPATGLGTRWRLHRLDLVTGRDRATRDVDGWFTAVHWSGRAFVALEQREPAPHTVVRGFATTDLRELWSVDLAREPGQEEMFSEDRIVDRPEPERPGLALDPPRLRDVGEGLVDPAAGRLVMMPHCSRLVDDSSRLWCNEVDGATAYSYAGRPLVRVHGPRLAFPDDDGIGVDHNSAVFLDDRQDRVVWRNTEVKGSDVPVLRGDQALIGEGRLTLVDLATGRAESEVETDGLFTVAVGDRVAEVGPHGISHVQI